ncbi:DNA-directed RNA polymerase specialized sigma24 family protein [Nonomuraea jabiensis]|uniref:DNA-directed RNA polymerase specialized sigma24 family protein n=1 Tax=Nonomuraea jabiensis TaxID=882448 RepID=A0A7W9GG26_9ACTN|nr:DNA-directed RNA polymerase specialized sigma24 family protein [Nonomuraea jabiensis]
MRPDQEKPADPLTRTQAFEDFYLRHFDMMTRFVARRIGNPHTWAISRKQGLHHADSMLALS